MNTPLRVEDMTDEQIRAMERGPKLSWCAAQFNHTVESNENGWAIFSTGKECMLANWIHGDNFPFYIAEIIDASRYDGAAMRLWKAIATLGEWQSLSKSPDGSRDWCATLHHKKGTISVHAPTPEHAIAILGALAAKWKRENGK